MVGYPKLSIDEELAVEVQTVIYTDSITVLFNSHKQKRSFENEMRRLSTDASRRRHLVRHDVALRWKEQSSSSLHPCIHPRQDESRKTRVRFISPWKPIVIIRKWVYTPRKPWFWTRFRELGIWRDMINTSRQFLSKNNAKWSLALSEYSPIH